MSKLALFRADALPHIGSGHVTRCLAIADTLAASGWTCRFVTVQGGREMAPALASARHAVIELPAERWDDPAPLSRNLSRRCDLLVIDHYELDRDYEQSCRPIAERILVIEDLVGRAHDCDVILDCAADGADGAHDDDFARCRLLAGPAYAPIHPQFAAARRKALSMDRKQPVKRILVSFGSADPGNQTESALEAIENAKVQSHVDVVLGPQAPHLLTVRARLANMRVPTAIHVGTDDMATLMAEADLAFGAGGTTSWERCCLGLPTLLITTAANQQRNARLLDRAGAAQVLEGDGEIPTAVLADALHELAGESDRRVQMSTAAAALCDGLGTARIRLAAEPGPTTANGAPVSLRPATLEDCDRVYRWRNHPRIRAKARNADKLDHRRHREWFVNRLSNPDSIMHIVLMAEVPAGVIRLDRADPDGGDTWEVSLFMAPELHGKGLGRASLALARALLPDACFLAEVLPGNAASKALFEGAGYMPSDGWYRNSPADQSKSLVE